MGVVGDERARYRQSEPRGFGELEWLIIPGDLFLWMVHPYAVKTAEDTANRLTCLVIGKFDGVGIEVVVEGEFPGPPVPYTGHFSEVDGSSDLGCDHRALIRGVVAEVGRQCRVA